MNFKRLLQAALLFIGLLFSVSLFAQQINPQNLSSVRVDELTDAQVRQFLTQVESLGLSEAQLEQMAQARGMSPTEIQKLRQRVDKLKREDLLKAGSKKPGALSNEKLSLRTGRTVTGMRNQDSLQIGIDSMSLADQALAKLRSRIFGADLFKTNGLSFEPNLRIATPSNYVIGPDDELLIDIYGYSEANYQLTVSPEGTINVPYVGVIQVGGLTIEAASSRIRSRLSTIYSGLRSGNTNVNIAVGNIRSIKVILTGEVVKPGTYTLPSLATAFNALYSSGGPTEYGSFRQIEIIRGGRKIATLDVYDFLLSGELKNNVRLQDQDVIRIPTYRKRVEIVGEVKRPGIFEMVNGEELSDLLRFAGDFTERAYQARVKVLKNTATERKISDVTSAQFGTYQPATGDKYFVDEILDRFENRVTIEGAVFRPGQFELEPGLTVGKLIQKAEGLREDAFQSRGYITRLKDDLQTELISFDMSKILSDQAADIPLKREDVVVISSIFDLKEEYNVRVEGEVQQPGKLDYAEGMTLEDAILQAGGLKESATTQRIEVSRRVKNSNALSRSATTAEVFQININEHLKAATEGFVLQPFDIVAVRSSAGYEVQRQVTIEGEVLYPGTYTLSKKDERVSDLIKRAGGFTALASPEGASLKRPGPARDSLELEISDNSDQVRRLQVENLKLKKKQEENEKLLQLQRLQSGVNETVELKEEEVIQNNYVGIDLPKILDKPGSRYDIFLEEGDILKIPKQLQTVKVTGEVLSPVTVVYSSGKSFRKYVSNAGGFAEKARKKNSYIIYANGSAKSTKKFFFFRIYPAVKPGAEIFVPRRANGRKLSAGELVGISSGLASLATIILTLLR